MPRIGRVVRHPINVVLAAVALALALAGNGAFHIVASEILADNVERAILRTLAARNIKARAVCPEHVRVLIGRVFDCSVTDAPGRHLTAAVTILDSDGGFRVGFS